MNKKEFITQMAKQAGLSIADAEKSLNSMLDIIVAATKHHEKVTLTGFGIFESRKTKATQRKNPQTGQRISVPAKVVPKFRPGRVFKESLLDV